MPALPPRCLAPAIPSYEVEVSQVNQKAKGLTDDENRILAVNRIGKKGHAAAQT